MSKVCIGAGNRPVPGFINYDLFENDHVIKGRADNLHTCEDSSVELIFSNAVFEHIGENEYPNVFKEWDRVLTSDGVIVCLGIPFFDLIAQAYLDRKLSLQKTHNYTTGVIEYTDSAEMLMGQIHKQLYNKEVLHDIFIFHHYHPKVFNYCHPGEELPLNLGVVATKNEKINSLEFLLHIPTIQDYIQLETIKNGS